MKIDKKKRTSRKTEAPTMAVRSALKKPEKNAQSNSGEKGWTWYYCGKDGHLKQDCPQASKLPLAPGPVCKRPYGEETVLCGVGPRGQTLKTIRAEGSQGSPDKHTS